MGTYEIVPREALPEEYQEMMATEAHHNHPIIRDPQGTLRWMPDPEVEAALLPLSLNDLVPLLHALGHGKNSEVYRHLYRCMGYSLFGYWEVFYWEVNNPEVVAYKPPVSGYLVLNTPTTPNDPVEGFFTQSVQLAYEVRKGSGTNCFYSDGTHSPTAQSFCEHHSHTESCYTVDITVNP
jgi:hypothetical protein